MGYEQLVRISNIIDTESRLKEYAKYYKSIRLNGLNYINQDKQSLSICKPNHSTHHGDC